jgi:menaquinone-dependent protoporphyrinogen IX oxidase
MGSKNQFHLGKKKKFIYSKIYKDRFCSNVQKYTHTHVHTLKNCAFAVFAENIYRLQCPVLAGAEVQ